MLTARVFCRRLRVLKSGTSRSSPMSHNRLRPNPVVCRVDIVARTNSATMSTMPNSTFIVRQVWHRQAGLASSGRSGWPYRSKRAVGHACRWAWHPTSSRGRTSLAAIAWQSPVGQRIVSEPRRLSASLAIGLDQGRFNGSPGGPVQGLVGRRGRSAHPPQLSNWIHKVNPLRPFVQQSRRL